MTRRRRAAFVLALALPAALASCDRQRSGPIGGEAVGERSGARRAPAALAVPSYDEIAGAHNERVSRLGRVWARAVVAIDYKDRDGRARWEQGEGHFQLIQPARMALSVGKLGEVFLWLGCDPVRYWLIDAKESRTAWTGRHALATREKIEALGLPAAPRELPALAGVTPIPVPAGRAPRPEVTQDRSGRVLSFIVPRAGDRWRYFFDARTYEPVRIEVLASDTDDPVITASLERYDMVRLRGVGGIMPRMATRIRCFHPSSGSTMTLFLSDMNDGGPGRLTGQNFDLESLAQLLGVRRIVDADAPPEDDTDGDSPGLPEDES